MKLVIDEMVNKKVMHWVMKAGKKEISGLGNIKIEGESFRVVSAILLPQKNGVTTTEISPEGICKAMYDLKDSEGELKWWWHSHVDMGVFWSGTDMDTIKQFGGNGWILATVFNKKKELKSAFYSKDGKVTPLGVDSLFIDNIPTKIEEKEIDTQEWDLDFKLNVTDFETNLVTQDQSSHNWGYGYRGIHDYDFKTDWQQNYEKTKYKLSKSEKRELRKQANEAKSSFTQDAYGLSGIDWRILNNGGYDNQTVDSLIQEGFQVKEILKLAKEDVTPQEVEQLLSAKYSVEEVMLFTSDMEGT